MDLHNGDEILKAVKLGAGRYRNLNTDEEYLIEGESVFSLDTGEEILRCGHEELDVALEDRVSVQGIQNGYVFYGPAAEVCYLACIDPRFWGTTGVPFYLNEGPGKRIYVGYADGHGAGRAALGGTKITMDQHWSSEPPILRNLLAHEQGHVNWLQHSSIPADLMSNPVAVNHFTTQNDRDRFVRAYTSHGGRLEPGPGTERMGIMDLRTLAESGRPLDREVILTYLGEDYAKARPLQGGSP